MAITFTEYNGTAEGVDGSQTLFGLTFEYIDESHIKVSINGIETTEYILANATQVQFNTAPADGSTVRIERVTPSDTLSHEFFSGSAIKAKNLNENFEQTLFVVQETIAAVASSDVGTLTTQINEANSNATNAIGIANGAVTTANGLSDSIDTANSTATNAVNIANVANTTASDASLTVNGLASNITTAQSEIDAVELRVDQVETDITDLQSKTQNISATSSETTITNTVTLTQQPRAFYYMTSGTSFTINDNDNGTKVDFDEVLYNIGGITANAAKDIFTVPASGCYQINSGIGMSQTSTAGGEDAVHFNVYVNGTKTPPAAGSTWGNFGGGGQSGAENFFQIHFALELNAGDEVSVAFDDIGTELSATGTRGYFNIIKLA